MKKLNKIMPLLLVASVLAGCGENGVSITNGDTKLINTSNETVSNISYQEFYDEVYEQAGGEIAGTALIYEVAKQVFKDSGRAQSEWNQRIEDAFEDFFNTSYMSSSIFTEDLLVSSLRSKGYAITCPTSTFKGTRSDLNGNSLYSNLKCDYSSYIENYLNGSIALDLLKEEYLLAEKQGYFKNKLIRSVQYFKFKPYSYVDVDEYTTKFEDFIARINTTDLSIIVNDPNGLDKMWRDYMLDHELQNYAKVDPTKSTIYADNYVDIFNLDVLEGDEKNEIEDLIKTYSNDNQTSFAKGHEIQLRVLDNAKYFYEDVGANEGATLIDPLIDELLFKSGSKLALNSNGFLLATSGSDSIVIKGSDAYYYIVKVKVIDANSSNEDKKLGAKALAKNSANTRNAVQYYLNKYNVTVHEDSLYSYLDEIYHYTSK